MRRELGKKYEKIARDYLLLRNLQCIHMNYHCRYGEVDLIMLETDTLAFIEVKYRKNFNFGNPIDFITKSKQQKIYKSALHYINEHPEYEKLQYRFDAVTINGRNLTRYINKNNPDINNYEIYWYKNIITIDNELILA